MNVYDSLRRCPKCGGGTTQNSWYKAGDGPYPNIHTLPERIMRHCQSCHYGWDEAPLDTQSSIVVVGNANRATITPAMIPGMREELTGHIAAIEYAQERGISLSEISSTGLARICLWELVYGHALLDAYEDSVAGKEAPHGHA